MSRNRLFYTCESKTGVQVVDCEKTQEEDPEVYRAVGNKTDENAIRVGSNGSKILLDDGEVEEASVEFVYEMDAQHEQYIYGGSASATKTHVKFMGPYNSRNRLPQYGSTVNVRVNHDAVVRGTADSTTSEWDWEILTEGDSLFVSEEPELTEFFGKECIVVGYEQPIETVELVRPVFESEDGKWIE